jgi:hypothetical protein
MYTHPSALRVWCAIEEKPPEPPIPLAQGAGVQERRWGAEACADLYPRLRDQPSERLADVCPQGRELGRGVLYLQPADNSLA